MIITHVTREYILICRFNDKLNVFFFVLQPIMCRIVHNYDSSRNLSKYESPQTLNH